MKSPEKLQEQIDSIGIVDFIEVDAREKFLSQVNEITEDRILSIVRKETGHALKVQSSKDGGHKIKTVPPLDELFEEIRLDFFAESEELITVVLCGVINTDKFREIREKKFEELDKPLKIEHAGLKVLEEKEKQLASYLRDSVDSTFFLKNYSKWEHRHNSNECQPSFWNFDLTEDYNSWTNFLDAARNDSNEAYKYIDFEEAVKEDKYSHPDDGKYLMTGSRSIYFNSIIASLPFRHIFIQFQEDDEPSLAFDQHFPGTISGTAELSRIYLSLFWNIHSYHRISQYNPENFDIKDSSNKGRENLEDLENNLESLNNDWRDIELQMDDIDKLLELKGLYASNEGIESLIETNDRIINYIEKEESRVRKRIKRLIRRQKRKLDIDIGHTRALLTMAVLIFTFFGILNQFNLPEGSVYGVSYENILPAAEIVLLGIIGYWLDLYGIFKRTV